VVRVGVVAAAPPPNPQPGVGPNPPPPAPPPVPPKPRLLTNAELDGAIKDLAVVDGFTRKRAADLLAGAEPKERRAEVVKALEPLLKDSDMWLRCSVIKALGTWGGKDSVPLLLPLLKDPQGFVQGATLEALGKAKDERAAEPVAECLPNFMVRGQASAALKAIGPPAEKAVLKYLTHQDIFLRQEVCRILKEIGTKQSIPGLQDILGMEDIHTRVHVAPAAKEALNAIKARG
jgi:HEAT repeat protein